MPSKSTALDPAVLRALSPLLPPSSTPKLSTHGGSGFAATYSITAQSPSDSKQKKFFMKTSADAGADVMFAGEYQSLNAIADAVPSLAPRAYGFGKLEDGNGHFLVTDFLHMGGGFGRRSSAGKSLAEKLAKLHSTPAPVPQGCDRPMFGFPVTTCCGDTPQDNSFSDDWADFYGRKRLMAILERGEGRNGKDGELRKNVERVVSHVVPRLLGKGHLGGSNGITPVVIHGDLWSGNKGTVTLELEDGAEATEEMVFDPSAVYGHSEYELGIMRMFGGFGGSFLREYHKILPKTEPVEEYEDRVNLYELYHHLNHWAIFGGNYRSGAMGFMKSLIQKYGDT